MVFWFKPSSTYSFSEFPAMFAYATMVPSFPMKSHHLNPFKNIHWIPLNHSIPIFFEDFWGLTAAIFDGSKPKNHPTSSAIHIDIAIGTFQSGKVPGTPWNAQGPEKALEGTLPESWCDVNSFSINGTKTLRNMSIIIYIHHIVSIWKPICFRLPTLKISQTKINKQITTKSPLDHH